MTAWQKAWMKSIFFADSYAQMFKTSASYFLGWSKEKVHGTDFDIRCPSDLQTYKKCTMLTFVVEMTQKFINAHSKTKVPEGIVWNGRNCRSRHKCKGVYVINYHWNTFLSTLRRCNGHSLTSLKSCYRHWSHVWSVFHTPAHNTTQDHTQLNHIFTCYTQHQSLLHTSL